MFRIISIENKIEWKDYILKCNEIDFYHTWDYHDLSKNNKEGEPELIVYEKDNCLICFKCFSHFEARDPGPGSKAAARGRPWPGPQLLWGQGPVPRLQKCENHMKMI